MDTQEFERSDDALGCVELGREELDTVSGGACTNEDVLLSVLKPGPLVNEWVKMGCPALPVKK